MVPFKRPVSHKLVIALAEIIDGVAMLLLLGFPSSIGIRLRAILWSAKNMAKKHKQ